MILDILITSREVMAYLLGVLTTCCLVLGVIWVMKNSR
jgi:heme/copper-type cytochrome/quinol oxidase subunit 4